MLDDYREFRHIIRNVYSFDLRTERVIELAHGLRQVYEMMGVDFAAFTQFLDTLSTADQS